MLSIKQLFSKFFKKTTNDNNPIDKSIQENICTIEMSLTKNFDVDIFVSFDNLQIKSTDDYITYINKISEFLNTINSQYVTYTLAKLILDDIGKDNKYKQFAEDIIQQWTILEKDKEKQKIFSQNFPLVRPMEVFSKYYNAK
jgi:hypothetical protein